MIKISEEGRELERKKGKGDVDLHFLTLSTLSENSHFASYFFPDSSKDYF
jgi:hypothetical protein